MSQLAGLPHSAAVAAVPVAVVATLAPLVQGGLLVAWGGEGEREALAALAVASSAAARHSCWPACTWGCRGGERRAGDWSCEQGGGGGVGAGVGTRPEVVAGARLRSWTASP